MRRLRAAGGAAAAFALATCLSGCFSAPPQIISLEPNRGSTSVAADAPVRVVFDKAVTRASVAGRFSVTPSIPGCDLATVFAAPSTAPCWIHWLSSAPGFELLHEEAPFAAATRYEFTLSGGFADAQGDRNTLDHHWDLTTASAPVVSATSPADRASGVALDASLSVSFNAPMDAPSTAAAISLDPPVAGTRVVRNTTDHTRFVILPGALLDPDVAYTITVSASARGEDQLPVAAGVVVHFSTGVRLASAHVAVLAGTPGQGATEVLEPALAAAATGEPVAAPVVMTAPRCALTSGCGAIVSGAPLATYAAAAISPDGARLAVVVDDAATGAATLEILDTTTDTILGMVGSGRLPSWSPDSARVALAEPAGVAVFDATDRRLSVVAAGAVVVVPPLWANATTLLISPPPGAPGPVEVVDRQLEARYTLPGVPLGAVATATSPAGDRAALADSGGSATVVALGAASAAVQTVADLRPVGFTADGGLLGVGDGGGLPVLTLVSPAGDTATVTMAGAADLATVRLAPDGRRLAVLGVDAQGVTQVYVADADGSGYAPLTRFLPGGTQALAIAFSD